ncbi:MAG: di-trans,poly-cis-decaprenylcistransferase [bacterium]|nr:di-trans,poly-cis-decaprenylcistransferase [bacterium]
MMSETPELLSQLRTRIDAAALPAHVAIIMDGNGRWATQQGKPRFEGHRVGVQSVKAVVEAARELGIEALTLYAFSSENWRRPALEIKALMTLLREYLKWELDYLNDLNSRLKTIGRTEELAPQVQEQLNRTIEQTESNTGMVLNLALNYGSRHEILGAIKNMYSDMDTNRWGGVVMILVSGVVFVVYALMITLADFGIRLVDALKSL